MDESDNKPVNMMALVNALRQSEWAANGQDGLDDNMQGDMVNGMRRSPWSVNLRAAPLLGPAVGHGIGGRVAYEHPIDDDRSVQLGLSGGYAQGRAGDTAISKGTLGGANLTYRNKDDEYGIDYINNMTPDGKPNKQVMATFRRSF